MQHNRAGRKLGRTTAHRRALFRNQLSSLFMHERITTTLYKAKELRPLAEKMITLGKRADLHARRLALQDLPDKTAVSKLFDDLAPRFKERNGGYTRILKLGRRQGDGAEVAILEFVDYDFAQRQAEKKQADKQTTEKKKESLLDKAKRLITGKKAESTEGETQAPASEAAAHEGTDEKKPKKVQKFHAPKGGKKGGGGIRVPRKQGNA